MRYFTATVGIILLLAIGVNTWFVIELMEHSSTNHAQTISRIHRIESRFEGQGK